MVLQCQGIPGARKEPDISIALDEYVVLKTYPDIQKVALGFENDHIRDHPSQFFFCIPDSYFHIKKSEQVADFNELTILICKATSL